MFESMVDGKFGCPVGLGDVVVRQAACKSRSNSGTQGPPCYSTVGTQEAHSGAVRYATPDGTWEAQLP